MTIKDLKQIISTLPDCAEILIEIEPLGEPVSADQAEYVHESLTIKASAVGT